MKILIKNQQTHRRLNRTRIKKTARKILLLLAQPLAEVSILFVGDTKMKRLNASFRGIPRTTDVLSFPQYSARELQKKVPGLHSELILGDIVISAPTAAAQATAEGADFYDEINGLLIHGILHLLGHDHEKSRYRAAVMRKKEREIFNAIKKMD